MLALTYHGAHNVKVETVADPVIIEADDIILRVTATAICGSDLHLFRGKVPGLKDGDILGHEFLGIVRRYWRGCAPAETRAACSRSVHDRVRAVFLLRQGTVRSLRNHELGARRDSE